MTDNEQTEQKTEETPEEPINLNDYDDLENFFIEEGQWIEEQLKAEDYENCPACDHMVECLKHLHHELQQAMEAADQIKEKSGETRASGVLNICRVWYLLYKEDFLSFLQAAHEPHKIMKAHPELAISKAQKRKIRSGKNMRKHAKKRKRK